MLILPLNPIGCNPGPFAGSHGIGNFSRAGRHAYKAVPRTKVKAKVATNKVDT
jgi:hypothetical protein